MLGEGWSIVILLVSCAILIIMGVTGYFVNYYNTFIYKAFENTTKNKRNFLLINIAIVLLFLITGFVFFEAFDFLNRDSIEDGTKIQEEEIKFYSDFNDNNIYSVLYEGKKDNYDLYHYYLVLRNEQGSPYNKTVSNEVKLSYKNVDKPVYVVRTYEYKTFLFYKKAIMEEIVFPLNWRNK